MISLHLHLDTKKVNIGALPVATLRILNEGPEEILLNSRMLLTPNGYPPNKKEITFLIKGPENAINQKLFHVNAGGPTSAHFVRLNPGEYIFTDYFLSKYFSYEVSGSYSIYAVYNNTMLQTINGLSSWIGNIKSNKEYFIVI